MKRAIIISITLMNWLFTSCKVINPAEDVPAYIHIDSIGLQITDASQGSGSQRVTDAWVYINGSYLGNYELPATFPVLAEGDQKITIGGGIWENGISSTRKFYTFYYPHTENRSLAPKSIDTIYPVVKYSDNVTFAFMEDFESVGTKFTTLSGDTSVQRVTDSTVFEGNGSGAVFLNDSTSSLECVTSDKFTIAAGTTVYVELNYKNNNTFSAGIYDNYTSEKIDLVFVNPKDSWNKIYINLTNVVANIRGHQFQLLFKVENKETNYPQVYWDNIKLIY